jgi:hypothetical protein
MKTIQEYLNHLLHSKVMRITQDKINRMTFN